MGGILAELAAPVLVADNTVAVHSLVGRGRHAAGGEVERNAFELVCELAREAVGRDEGCFVAPKGFFSLAGDYKCLHQRLFELLYGLF